MQSNEYNQAWGEGEEPAPASEAVSAARKAAESKRDQQAKEFSDAFFADEIESSAGDAAPKVEEPEAASDSNQTPAADNTAQKLA